MDIQQTLIDFSNHAGVSGMEYRAGEFARTLLAPYGKVQTTPLRSVVCTLKAPKEGKPHVMLVAHMDENGLVIKGIDKTGFLRVANSGGLDRNTLPAAPVTVHSRTGDYKGVIVSTPPHLQEAPDNKKLPKIEDLFVDIGYSKEEAEKRVRIGDSITMDAVQAMMLNNQLCCKAGDDRACCVAFLRVCELLQNETVDCGVTVVFSSMEEVGGHGARTATAFVKPTHAIVSDVSFAFTPDAKRHRCLDMGKGPTISYAPLLNDDMTEALLAVAKEKEIPYQVDAMGGGTGTDADGVAVYGCGVKTALISLPQKYMHSTIETVSVDDIENLAQLVAEYIKTIQE